MQAGVVDIDYIQATQGLVMSRRVGNPRWRQPSSPTCFPSRRVAHGEQLSYTVLVRAVFLNERKSPAARVVGTATTSPHSKARRCYPFPSAALHRHDYPTKQRADGLPHPLNNKTK